MAHVRSAVMEAAADDRLTVLYLIAKGRSGSNILAHFLGQLDSYCNTGELHHLWQVGAAGQRALRVRAHGARMRALEQGRRQSASGRCGSGNRGDLAGGDPRLARGAAPPAPEAGRAGELGGARPLLPCAGRALPCGCRGIGREGGRRRLQVAVGPGRSRARAGGEAGGRAPGPRPARGGPLVAAAEELGRPRGRRRPRCRASAPATARSAGSRETPPQSGRTTRAATCRGCSSVTRTSRPGRARP